MAKIHTHYDNLKVSRKAPPEVIRAAYKALSQKYHPDKNPDNEKAARIMAVVNSAYNALSNAQSRKEHDEWIAAEEWEIEWLESTRAEDGKDRHLDEQAPAGWTAVRIETAPARRLRLAKRALVMLGCVALGWGAAAWFMAGPPTAEAGNSAGNNGASEVGANATLPVPKSAALSGLAVLPPPTRVLVLSQIRLPELGCELDSVKPPQDLSWPAHSGYLPDLRVGNNGGDTQLVIDNSNNGANVAVQLFDVDKNENVRHIFILAHDKFMLQKLTAGNYEVHVDMVELNPADKAECEARQRRSSGTRSTAAAGRPGVERRRAAVLY